MEIWQEIINWVYYIIKSKIVYIRFHSSDYFQKENSRIFSILLRRRILGLLPEGTIYPTASHFAAGGGAYGDSLHFPKHLQKSPFSQRTQHLRQLGQQMKITKVCVILGTGWNFLVLFFQTAAIWIKRYSLIWAVHRLLCTQSRIVSKQAIRLCENESIKVK